MSIRNKKILENFPLIILAAGKSSRFGYPKGLAPLADGTPWLQNQVETAENIGIRTIVLVLGPDHEHYKDALMRLSSRFCSPPGTAHPKEGHEYLPKTLKVLINPATESGPWVSLGMALSWLLKEGDQDLHGIFLLPIDVPVADAKVWHTLIKNHTPRTGAVIPRYHDKGGHPVLFSLTLAKQIIEKSHLHSRLDYFLQDQIPGIVSKVSVDDYQVSLNINTQEDWNLYRQGVTRQKR